MEHLIEWHRAIAASAVSILCACGSTVSLGNAADSATGAATSLGGTTLVATRTGGRNSLGGSQATSGAGGAAASSVVTGLGGAQGVAANGGTVATGGIKGTGGRSVASSGQQADASACTTQTDANCVVRVASTGNDANSGSSWSEALGSVQEGLDAASALVSDGTCCNVEVWVAAGTYSPTDMTDSTDARTATFQLVPNVGLFGGFSGTESLRSDRRTAANVTILSGDIGIPGDDSDNSYHVVTGVTGATMDGFTITGGNANGGWALIQDRGGGIFNSKAAPTISNCTFTQNNGENGAAVYNYNASPSITNCTFTNNAGGDVLFSQTSSVIVANSLFANNSGAGIYSTDMGSPEITNCTIVNNAGAGIVNGCAGMYCDRTPRTTVTNSILWGNAAISQIDDPTIDYLNEGITDPMLWSYYAWAFVSNSLIQGGYHAQLNTITADPLFVDPANGDFRLSADSPAIDAGNGCADYVTLTDLAGNSRWDIASVPNVVNGVDIGAFEYQGVTGVDALIPSLNCN